MTDPATTQWLADQQRRHNLNTYRWAATKRPYKPRYKFTPEQLATAIRSLEKAEQHGHPQSS